MRPCVILMLAAGLSMAGMALADGAPAGSGQPNAPLADAGAQAALRLDIDKSKVDVKGHRLEATATRELSKLTIKVLGESGAVLAQDELSFAGRAAGTVLVVTWTPSSNETVARIELVAHDTAGNWVGVAVIPWSVSIPHEEVRFRTGSADIDDSEKNKLEASYAKVTEVVSKHQDLGRITLFIAGHTDTVGRTDDNLRLSRRRAQAISGWFRRRGLTLPIAHEGFGEHSLLVDTPDNVDEPRNRRVDYILSLDLPVYKTTGGFRPAWKQLN